MNRQIEILANKVKPKVSNDVLVREGWLDKRSERIYQSNVRCSTHSSATNADLMIPALQKDGHELEDVAAQVILFVLSFGQRHSVTC